MNTAYVYKWLHKPSYMWYVGSRTAKDSHPNDGYVCSSKIVFKMIKQSPNEWERTILAVGDPKEMYDLETEILQTVDARNDPRSFNKHNNEGKKSCYGHKCSEETKIKIGLKNKGRGGALLKGIPRSEETKEKIRLTMVGQKYDEARCAAMRKPKKKITCPHCEKTGNAGSMKRWHFDRCKYFKEDNK